MVVEWVDAASKWGDYKLSDVVEPLPLRKSIGFLTRHDKAEVRLASTDDRANADLDSVGDILRIPVGMVKRIVFLKEIRTRAQAR